MVRISRSLREALRALLRKPGVTALAVSSLALAIGFSTAAFSVLDAYALRDLPVRDPARLVWLEAITREGRSDNMSWPEYQTLVSRAHAFEGILAENRRGPRIRLPDRDDFPITAGVSDNYFDLLGVQATAGRVFHPGTENAGTVVVTDRYWRDALKADPGAIGRTLLVGGSGSSLRVLGILPAEFSGTARGVGVDLFVPAQSWFAMGMGRANDVRFADYDLLARLRPGATPAQAQAECEGILRQMEKDNMAAGPDRKAHIESFTEKGLGAKLKSNAVMLGVVALLVLIAAANLANLRLVENEGRRRETGVRLALGAGRSDLAITHMAETLVLSGVGTGLGVLLAFWLLRAAPALFYGGSRTVEYHIRMDARTLAFSSGALVATALIGALIPLGDAWRRRVLPVMQSNRVTGSSRWLAVLVITQMALVTGVTCASGLLWRSLHNLEAVRPAMDPDRKLLLIGGFLEDRQRAAELGALMAQAPGVEQVAWARRAQLQGSLGGATVSLEFPGQPRQEFHFNQVSPSYFAVTGARVVRGRPFAEADGPQSTLVVMVNETFVRRFFGPQNDPLGQWVRARGKDHQIVGIVEDGPTNWLRQANEPYLYFPFAQMPNRELTYFAASSRDPSRLADSLRAVVRASARDFTILSMTTLRQHMRAARRSEELTTTVAGSLAALGLFLAAAGLFGVTMFAVARRTPEIGIRMAMGATPGRVAVQVLRQAVVRVAIALPLGWLLAWAGRQAIQKMLFGVAPDDPATFLGASLVVALVACAAALHPALRAARVDPMAALRHE